MSPDFHAPRLAAPAESLLAPLPAEAARLLDGYRRLLSEAMPLPPRHLRELPANIRRLSRELTSERSEGFTPKYMSDPAAVSAYCHYFLPWNLYRLARLFTGLGPMLPELGDGDAVADLGAGPLTAAQALWIARPELRKLRLKVYAVDRAMKPMSVGLSLFDALRGEDRSWDVRLIQGPLTTRLPERVRLLMAANVLNESGRLGRDEEERAYRLARHLSQSLVPPRGEDGGDGGRLLLVEPGARSGGQLVSMMRRELGEEGLFPYAPCGHDSACPFPGTGGRSWCHFPFDVEDAPAWLASLTRKAGLEKEEVTLSFLLAGEGEPAPGRSRVVSRSFAVEGPHGRTGGVYVCGGDGLVLLTGGRHVLGPLKPGVGLELEVPEDAPQDRRSGARIVELSRPRGPRPEASVGSGPSKGDGKPGKPGKPGRTGGRRDGGPAGDDFRSGGRAAGAASGKGRGKSVRKERDGEERGPSKGRSGSRKGKRGGGGKSE